MPTKSIINGLFAGGKLPEITVGYFAAVPYIKENGTVASLPVTGLYHDGTNNGLLEEMKNKFGKSLDPDSLSETIRET